MVKWGYGVVPVPPEILKLLGCILWSVSFGLIKGLSLISHIIDVDYNVRMPGLKTSKHLTSKFYTGVIVQVRLRKAWNVHELT